MAIGPLEEMLERPECPNLYWALTNLPDPLVPLHKGLEGERGLSVWLFRDLDENAPMSADRLDRYIAPLDRLVAAGKPIKPGDEVRAWLAARTRDNQVVDAARRRLVAHGLPESQVPRFPAEQVILLDEKREYEVRRDELLKLANLPMWQALPLAVSDQARRGPCPGFAGLRWSRAWQYIHWAKARLEQRIAPARHV